MPFCMTNENAQNMTPLEQQQIRGITVKNLYGLIGATVVITGAVLTTVGSVRDDIKDLKRYNETQATVNGLTIKALEGRMSTIEADNKEIHYRLNRLETRDGEHEIKNR